MRSPFLSEISCSSTDLVSDAIQVKSLAEMFIQMRTVSPGYFLKNARHIHGTLISCFMKIVSTCVFAENGRCDAGDQYQHFFNSMEKLPVYSICDTHVLCSLHVPAK
jgi:hypothetical protein